MDDAVILEQLSAIVADALDLDHIELTPETVATEVEGWDSLNHVRIVVAVEEAFHVRFKTGEITSLKKVGDLMALVAQHVKP